jgi:hypothetical protein
VTLLISPTLNGYVPGPPTVLRALPSIATSDGPVRFRSGYEGGGGDGSELQLLMRSLEEFFQAEAAGALHLRIGLKPQQ